MFVGAEGHDGAAVPSHVHVQRVRADAPAPEQQVPHLPHGGGVAPGDQGGDQDGGCVSGTVVCGCSSMYFNVNDSLSSERFGLGLDLCARFLQNRGPIYHYAWHLVYVFQSHICAKVADWTPCETGFSSARRGCFSPNPRPPRARKPYQHTQQLKRCRPSLPPPPSAPSSRPSARPSTPRR